ncbi:hypothetical protein GGQ73_002103 [Rhizobium skierniewicense]|uniref:Uncharacterized protein n=1 Tax=Rhizobium skierniewicense TaxID=984260 RepID=A0A7W6CAC6_9HYPH|nr:hypothetical protein [Rhizobium skierniewicense]MBB3946157.1 hypothetical protein [Rhizobium skierniewicense]
MRALIYSFFIMCIAGPSSARDLTDFELMTLHVEIAGYETAMKRHDLAKISETVPPRIIHFVAQRAGVPDAQVRSVLTAELQTIMATVTFLKFEMDEKNIAFRQTPTGVPYALVPSMTLMEIKGVKMEANSETLAIIDGKDWYLLRVDDESQISALRQVYPDFADVTFPTGSVKEVE